ncbi:hypothetical protein [Neisseria sp.]|uniref:hypothetical protein n=1 Tax=Neisseria sp. TaxID=192066 RepID=UPI0026DAD2F4|nr:hypothetical protein [Neisseria sp.]MDO4226293.1 hypothetical protein [Neisseria sp.]
MTTQPLLFRRLCASLLLCAALPACAADAGGLQQLQQVFEPSGAIQLADGRVLTVEDEAKRAFNLLDFKNGSLHENEAADAELLASFNRELSDLEALAQDGEGWIYAVSSHSETKQNERQAGREHLVRFKIQGNRAAGISYAPNLKDALLQNESVRRSIAAQTGGRQIDFHTMNIEGLHYDTAAKRLLLALRDPLPLIVAVDNPQEVFGKGAAPKFGETAVLKLNGGGIRSLAYDPVLKTYLIANEITGSNGKGQSQLWTWNGRAASAPVALNLPAAAGLKNIEAVTPVSAGGKPYLLLMGDEGSAKKQRGARYVLVDYGSLKK